jgi:hypothetical protein
MSSRFFRGIIVAVSATIASLCLAPTVQAQRILYFSDLSLGTDAMEEALFQLSSTYTVFTTGDATTFTTALALGNFDLAIFFQQNLEGYDTAYQAIASYVAGGGKAIGADWTRTQSHAAVFGTSFTGNINETQVTVTEPAFASGLTNPVALFNPGWGVFSTGLSGGVSAATFDNGESAIVIGNSGRTIFNGFLNDTFADTAQGVQLYKNDIAYLLPPTQPPAAVPEPGQVASGLLLSGSVVGLVARRRMTRSAKRTGAMNTA